MSSAALPSWDPGTYGRYERERLRPALDLLARVPPLAARRVVDLGCGAGGPTRALAARFPEAEIVGVDGSADMLREAAAAPGGERIRWRHEDLASWRPQEPLDLVFSNAALHWLDDHPALFARLARALAPGGVLAVQMPASHDLASHRLLRATLAERAPDGKPFGSDALRARRERRPVAEPLAYRRWLAPCVRSVDVWLYEYEQELEGEDAVLAWVRGTALRPVQDELAARPAGVREAFLERYRALLAEAYPPDASGRTRFDFPRLFVVARG